MLSFFKSLFKSTNEPREESISYRKTIDIEQFRQYQTSVAGITFENLDGSSRELIASRCRYGQKLLLTREPENPHDSKAVKILTQDGQQLGYLDKKEASDMQALLKGTSKTFSHVEAYFLEFTEFENDKGKLIPSCEICIRKYYKNKY
ncbi:hypothetical protein J40TS1_34450 [Paenibacillus montaniterrae]|uniref:HIRAN domain-containing protein n=1 Tax=Paenibacillus montaniterrae TaxID=429341 RepID=A0A919YPS1_9BACL|nr:HIRAN domain-containing protein [Paenibacillus montaniterrae]GIP17803.1 hypothetical protein J40TS1_34450 [Paenibacillus montaniterrae]